MKSNKTGFGLNEAELVYTVVVPLIRDSVMSSSLLPFVPAAAAVVVVVVMVAVNFVVLLALSE